MSARRVRLFVALELPEPARAAVTAWREEALAGIAGLRLIAPRDLHATLCFLGWRELGDVEPIREACRAVAGGPPPELRLGRALWLPPRRPRVLAVELEDPGGGLAALQAALARALQAGGWYEPETRPYLAHVTVARVGRGARVPPQPPPAPAALALTASRVTLYRSHLARAGASYEALAAVEVRGR